MNLRPAHRHLKDANKEFEWRNQAGGHIDCFLKYREVAEFILVADIDDVLSPRLGKNYAQECTHLASRYPSSVGFIYNRYNTEVVSSKSSLNFSLFQLIESARISYEWEDEKSVIRPSRVHASWIHWPSIVESGYRMYTVSEDQNFMVHFRNWTMTDLTSRAFLKVITLHDQQMSDIIHPDKAEILEKNAERFIADYAAHEFETLPTNTYHYPLIEECYNRIFIPSLNECDLSTFVPGVFCVMAKRYYAHQYISGKLEVHYPLYQDEFEPNPNGCRMFWYLSRKVF